MLSHNTIKVEKMIIIGQVSSKEEVKEVRFIAQVFTIGQRIQYLSKSAKKKK